MSRSKQTPVRGLFAKQHPFELRRLAGAFLEMAGALKSRPEPRAWFDNVASPDRADPKGLDAVLAGRAVINAAIAEESSEVLEESAARCRRYCRTIEDLMLASYYAITNGSVSPAEARKRASKEGHEALHEMWASGDLPSDLTIREVDEAIEWFVTYRASLVTHVMPPLNRHAQMAIL